MRKWIWKLFRTLSRGVQGLPPDVLSSSVYTWALFSAPDVPWTPLQLLESSKAPTSALKRIVHLVLPILLAVSASKSLYDRISRSTSTCPPGTHVLANELAIGEPGYRVPQPLRCLHVHDLVLNHGSFHHTLHRTRNFPTRCRLQV